ncbi:MAG: MFS transporter [Deltaproteobacteria bacterium]|nr:MFS transporter [Deltaproteobacteria bacterium]
MSESNIFNRARAKSKNIFYGWKILAASFFINAFGVGTFFYGFSTFFNPMVEEFGWSRAMMAGVYSLSRLEGGIEGPVVGWLIDKFGARKIMFIGISLAGVGYILISRINSLLGLYLVFGLTLSLGFNLGYMHGTGAAVAKWFIKKRGRALSILTTGNGVGGTIFVPLIAWLIVQFGWRWAAVLVGISTLCVPLPLALIIRSTPEEKGLRPDGDPVKPESASSGDSPESIEDSDEVNYTVLEAMKTKAFWIYVSSMVLRSCILSSIVVHQIPHLTDIGFSYQRASSILGLMIFFSLFGRFSAGWLGDYWDKRKLLFFLCLLQAVGLFIFINARSMELLYLFVVVYGVAYGAVIPLTMALRADLFGRTNYATISGISMSFTTVGTVAAPVLAGILYDTTQSYAIAFYTFTVMISISGVLFLFLPRMGNQKS